MAATTQLNESVKEALDKVKSNKETYEDVKFRFIIKVGGKEVWRGMNPKERYWEVKKANPKKKVSIVWETKEQILVA